MSLALSTTKRKFHKILDSISNASSTTLASSEELRPNNASTPSLTVNIERPVKRARPASAFVQSLASRAQGSQSSTFRDRVKVSTPGAMGEERKLPNFAPWDRGQFLDRLKTFRHVDKWMGKPDAVNEVQWAKRGWSCAGKERVKCVGGCGKEVVVKLENDWNVDEEPNDEGSAEDDQDWRKDAEEQLVERYVELITSGHDGGCLWRRRGCDGIELAQFWMFFELIELALDTIHRLPLAHQNTALTNLRLRYESLAAMSTELPSNISTPPSVDPAKLSDQASSFLVSPSQPSATPITSANPETQAPIDAPALMLAVFGWQAEPSTIQGLASCAACFRRLGLWLFKPNSRPSSPDGSSPSMARLDAVAEHREYCPWINASSQGGGSNETHQNPPQTSTADLAGWELLLRAINNTQRSRRDAAGLSPRDEQRVDGAMDVISESNADAASLGSNVTAADAQSRDTLARDEKDKERWAKLKRLKQVFHVKRGKGKLGTKGKEKQTLPGAERARSVGLNS